MSLYQKYRPLTLSDVVGRELITGVLRAAITEGKLSHAYLFCGVRGTGKTTVARILARAINCLNRGEDGEPCNVCANCTAQLSGSLVDTVEIDAASNRSIDDIRELKERIAFAPLMGKAKVYIIDEVHGLTKDAFNALLKTLEEPPSHAYFMLATTEAHKVPETIQSRCLRFDFGRIPEEVIVQRLRYVCDKEGIRADEEALSEIARLAEGGLRDALTALEQAALLGEVTLGSVLGAFSAGAREECRSFAEAAMAGDAAKGFALLDAAAGEGTSLAQFVKEVLIALREEMERCARKGDMPAALRAAKVAEYFLEAADMRASQLPRMNVAIALVKACAGEASAAMPAGAVSAAPVVPAAAREVAPVTAAAPVVPVMRDEAREAAPVVAASAVPAAAKVAGGVFEMAAVVKGLTNTAAKQALKMGQVVEVTGERVRIAFAANIYMQKVMEPAATADIQRVLGELYGSGAPRMEYVLDAGAASAAPVAAMPAPKGDILETAKALFGESGSF